MEIAQSQAVVSRPNSSFREEKERYRRQILRFARWGFAIIVFSVTVAIRIRLLGMPLERDEGEYAYAGQLMLQGTPPYKLAENMKFAGTYAAYAVIMSIFGQTTTGIHLGLLVVNAATIALIFFLGRRLMNSTAGIAAAVSYSVLSVSQSVLGFAGHATHFGNAAFAPRTRSATIGPIVRQRIALWSGAADEAAGGFLHSVWSDLSRLKRCSPRIQA
jgi:hypothetical protein